MVLFLVSPNLDRITSIPEDHVLSITKIVIPCRRCKIPRLCTSLIDECCIECAKYRQKKTNVCLSCLDFHVTQENRCYQCWYDNKPKHKIIKTRETTLTKKECTICKSSFLSAKKQERICEKCISHFKTSDIQCRICHCHYSHDLIWDGICRRCIN